MKLPADCVYDGVRWWLHRFDGVDGCVVMLSGLDGGAYVVAIVELPDADPAAVKAWLVRTLAKI